MTSGFSGRRTLLIVLAFLLAILFAIAICFYVRMLTFPYQGIRRNSPYNYPGSVWVSDDPEIYLAIPETGVTIQATEAWLVRDGERIDVDICFDYGDGVGIFPDVESPALDKRLYGTLIRCTQDFLEIRVKNDTLLDGRCERLTLHRITEDRA